MTGYEQYRTRKGFILENPEGRQWGSTFDVWIRRDDGTDILIETVQDFDLAVCVLRDYRPGTEC